MEKFDLERALAGEPVCTRNGKDVTHLTFFDVDSRHQVVGVVEKSLIRWTKKGYCFDVSHISEHDLFMKPKEKVIWVNVYKSVRGFLFLGNQFDTEEEAIDDAKGESIFVKRLRITDKPDTI
jgi:hypothetical protein